jgi:hypothetical protein
MRRPDAQEHHIAACDEIQSLLDNELGNWHNCLQEERLLDADGCFSSRRSLMALLTNTRLV